MNNDINIGIIGLGKLGLECAEVFAKKYPTFGYDIYPRTSDSVKVCGTVEETVNNSDWIFIAVQTPHEACYGGDVPSAHLEPKDFNYDTVKNVLTQINEHADASKNIVLISTVLPGTTRREFDNLLDNHTLIYNPYLIAMGTVAWDMVNPEMVIIGSKDANDPRVEELIDIYKPLMKNQPRYETGTWEEAEAIKIFYNTYISAKVGIVNMIQDFAMKIGHMNVDVVTDAMANSTMRLQSPKYMTAGMGDAGACVLPTFTVMVNDEKMLISNLYEKYIQNPDEVLLVDSANYACSAIDQKKIDKVTCRDYNGIMYKFIQDGKVLETTPEHLIPVMRDKKRHILRADEIQESDKLIIL